MFGNLLKILSLGVYYMHLAYLISQQMGHSLFFTILLDVSFLVIYFMKEDYDKWMNTFFFKFYCYFNNTKLENNKIEWLHCYHMCIILFKTVFSAFCFIVIQKGVVVHVKSW